MVKLSMTLAHELTSYIRDRLRESFSTPDGETVFECTDGRTDFFVTVDGIKFRVFVFKIGGEGEEKWQQVPTESEQSVS